MTLVTYGACCPIALQAAAQLQKAAGVEVEVIDVQSLLPFDTAGSIAESIKRTNRVLFLDEDVPGGATAYMMQEVLERQGAFHWLDAAPRTLAAAPHRPAYGRDGDYWSKPSAEDVFDVVYEIMAEARPRDFPSLGEASAHHQPSDDTRKRPASSSEGGPLRFSFRRDRAMPMIRRPQSTVRRRAPPAA